MQTSNLGARLPHSSLEVWWVFSSIPCLVALLFFHWHLVCQRPDEDWRQRVKSQRSWITGDPNLQIMNALETQEGGSGWRSALDCAAWWLLKCRAVSTRPLRGDFCLSSDGFGRSCFYHPHQQTPTAARGRRREGTRCFLFLFCTNKHREFCF